MKNGKKLFILIEAVLGAMVLVVALLMLMEKRDSGLDKISVIMPNAEDNQWAAFRYGLEMAAEDQGVEVFVVSTGASLTVEEERELIEAEIKNGADAVVVKPVPGILIGEMLRDMNGKIPVVLSGGLDEKNAEIARLPVIEPDNYEMGKALAEEVLADYGGSLEGKTIGILSRTGRFHSSAERERGFRETLRDTGVVIRWTLRTPVEEEEGPLREQAKVDLVAAFDDDSLTEAGEYSALGGLDGAGIYGIGHSTESAYYLDTGVAQCMVVPDEFNVGYQSLTEAVNILSGHYNASSEKAVTYTVIRRETLFTEENQEILFRMSQ